MFLLHYLPKREAKPYRFVRRCQNIYLDKICHFYLSCDIVLCAPPPPTERGFTLVIPPPVVLRADRQPQISPPSDQPPPAVSGDQLLLPRHVSCWRALPVSDPHNPEQPVASR